MSERIYRPLEAFSESEAKEILKNGDETELLLLAL